MRQRLSAGLGDLPVDDWLWWGWRHSKHRVKQIVLRPLSHPFLPIWAATKALEPGAPANYYLKWFILSTVLYAIGDDVRARLAEASDDSTPNP